MGKGKELKSFPGKEKRRWKLWGFFFSSSMLPELRDSARVRFWEWYQSILFCSFELSIIKALFAVKYRNMEIRKTAPRTGLQISFRPKNYPAEFCPANLPANYHTVGRAIKIPNAPKVHHWFLERKQRSQEAHNFSHETTMYQNLLGSNFNFPISNVSPKSPNKNQFLKEYLTFFKVLKIFFHWLIWKVYWRIYWKG